VAHLIHDLCFLRIGAPGANAAEQEGLLAIKRLMRRIFEKESVHEDRGRPGHVAMDTGNVGRDFGFGLFGNCAWSGVARIKWH
jgi:hypothetical protein